ncbi:MULTISPECIES: methyltransferase [Actinomadura]|uniref:methyltransferase n=1 Tax=Actinomadura TaxID=1988 RepID=UPI0004206AB6|nr:MULTISPECIES: methyltransferase [Actinomadura]RSN71760.1 hydroxyneurosporene methyltransferase [Actinomadura sp. WAC 06369]
MSQNTSLSNKAEPDRSGSGSGGAKGAGRERDVVDDADPRALIWDLLRGQWRFSALYAFVELDVAGALGDGPLTAGELAERLGVDRVAVGRLLRTVAALGVARSVGGPETPRYALTAAGDSLRADAPGSMRSVSLLQGAPVLLDAMESLADAVRQGRSSFAARFGSFYGWLATDADARRHFDVFMTTRSRAIADAAVAAYDFAGIGTLADIGGGKGTVLATALRATPGMRGMLLDLEPVMAGARAFLAAEGVADRCELVVGDFFRAVPRADAYLLSNIVHNWDDDDALRILGNIRRELPADGRVLLLDMLLPEDDRPHLGKEMDMRLLALYDGGRERGEQEYLALLGKAGLRTERVVELPNALSLVDARPE